MRDEKTRLPVGQRRQRLQERDQIVDLGGSSLAAVGNAKGTMVDAALEVIATTSFGNYSLSAFLQAVQTVSLADVQAEPVISTLDNTAADLLVGEETPIRVIDAGTAGAIRARYLRDR